MPQDFRPPKTGDRRFSPHFGDKHVVLTRYFNDNHWYFYVEGDPRKEELHARTRWSEMPLPETPS